MSDLSRGLEIESLLHNRIRPIPEEQCSTEAFIRRREVQTTIPSTSHRPEPIPSLFSADVDRWLGGDSSAIDTSIQSSNIRTSARATLASSTSFLNHGIWYTLAMILPLLNYSNSQNWRCTPSFLITSGETVFSHMATLCVRARDHVSSFSNDQAVRDIFAVALDIVLLIYAIGFLILSICQASVTQSR